MAGQVKARGNSANKAFDDILSRYPESSTVYVRYKDHVIYRNVQEPLAEPIERETIGWLTKQNEEIILIEHDRTIQETSLPCGQGNGLILLKSCILEIRRLPLQKNSNWHLNSQDDNIENEYALKPKKRKTPNTRTGANK